MGKSLFKVSLFILLLAVPSAIWSQGEGTSNLQSNASSENDDYDPFEYARSRWFDNVAAKKDAVVYPYVRGILDRLIAKSKNPKLKVELYVVYDETINASIRKTKGRLIIMIHRGLLDILKTEGLVAFVLAHELGHYFNGDLVKSGIDRLIYSQRQEIGADAFAMDLGADAGFNQDEAIEFDDLIEAIIETKKQTFWQKFTSTHPMSSQRKEAKIAYKKALKKKYKLSTLSRPVPYTSQDLKALSPLYAPLQLLRKDVSMDQVKLSLTGALKIIHQNYTEGPDFIILHQEFRELFDLIYQRNNVSEVKALCEILGGTYLKLFYDDRFAYMMGVETQKELIAWLTVEVPKIIPENNRPKELNKLLKTLEFTKNMKSAYAFSDKFKILDELEAVTSPAAVKSAVESIFKDILLFDLRDALKKEQGVTRSNLLNYLLSTIDKTNVGTLAKYLQGLIENETRGTLKDRVKAANDILDFMILPNWPIKYLENINYIERFYLNKLSRAESDYFIGIERFGRLGAELMDYNRYLDTLISAEFTSLTRQRFYYAMTSLDIYTYGVERDGKPVDYSRDELFNKSAKENSPEAIFSMLEESFKTRDSLLKHFNENKKAINEIMDINLEMSQDVLTQLLFFDKSMGESAMQDRIRKVVDLFFKDTKYFEMDDKVNKSRDTLYFAIPHSDLFEKDLGLKVKLSFVMIEALREKLKKLNHQSVVYRNVKKSYDALYAQIASIIEYYLTKKPKLINTLVKSFPSLDVFMSHVEKPYRNLFVDFAYKYLNYKKIKNIPDELLKYFDKISVLPEVAIALALTQAELGDKQLMLKKFSAALKKMDLRSDRTLTQTQAEFILDFFEKSVAWIDSPADWKLYTETMNHIGKSLAFEDLNMFIDFDLELRLRQLHQRLWARWSENEILKKSISAQEVFETMIFLTSSDVLLKGYNGISTYSVSRGPLLSMESDRFFYEHVLPIMVKQRKIVLSYLEKQWKSISSRNFNELYVLISENYLEKTLREIIQYHYLKSPRSALQLILTYTAPQSSSRRSLIRYVTKNVSLDRETLVLFEKSLTSNPTGIVAEPKVESSKVVIFERGAWPLVQESKSHERYDVVLWLHAFIDNLPQSLKDHFAQNIFNYEYQSNNRMVSKFSISEQDFLNMYSSLDLYEKPFVLYPLFVGEEGILGHPTLGAKHKQELRQLLSDTVTLPDYLEEIMDAFLLHLDNTDLAMFYARIFPELQSLRNNPQRFARVVFECLGLVGEKMMQVLSEMPWIEESYRKEFEKSKSAALPMMKHEMMAELNATLKSSEGKAFLRNLGFVWTMGERNWWNYFTIGRELGSGTIKVAYEATLKTLLPRKVVLKILRPGIIRHMEEDLKLIESAMQNYNGKFKSFFNMFLSRLRAQIEKEIELTKEAEKSVKMRENEKGHKRLVAKMVNYLGQEKLDIEISIPKVLGVVMRDTDHGKAGVMVEEFVPGVMLGNEVKMREAGLDPAQVAKAMVRAVMVQLFYRGLANPDIHTDNEIAYKDVLYFIDLAQSFEASPDELTEFANFLIALNEKSAEEIYKSWMVMVDENETDRSEFKEFAQRLQEELVPLLEGERNVADLLSAVVRISGESNVYLRGTHWDIVRLFNYLQESLRRIGDPKFLADAIKLGIATRMASEQLGKKAAWLMTLNEWKDTFLSWMESAKQKMFDALEWLRSIFSRGSPVEEDKDRPEDVNEPREGEKPANIVPIENKPVDDLKAIKPEAEGNNQAKPDDNTSGWSNMKIDELITRVRLAKTIEENNEAGSELLRRLEEIKDPRMLKWVWAQLNSEIGKAPRSWRAEFARGFASTTAHFFVACYVATFLRIAFDETVGFDDFVEQLRHTPKEFFRFVTFSVGAAAGTHGLSPIVELLPKILEKKLMKQSGAALAAAVKSQIAERGASKLITPSLGTRMLRSQVGFICGMIVNKIVWDKKDASKSEFWHEVLGEASSFWAAQLMVKGTVKAITMTKAGAHMVSVVEKGKLLLRFGKMGSPVGWVLTAVELGVEMYLSGIIMEEWMKGQATYQMNWEVKTYLDEMQAYLKGGVRKAAFETTEDFTMAGVPVPMSVPMKHSYAHRCNQEANEYGYGTCFVKELRGVLDEYLMSLSLYKVNKVRAKYVEKEAAQDAKYRVAPLGSEYKVLYPDKRVTIDPEPARWDTYKRFAQGLWSDFEEDMAAQLKKVDFTISGEVRSYVKEVRKLSQIRHKVPEFCRTLGTDEMVKTCADIYLEKAEAEYEESLISVMPKHTFDKGQHEYETLSLSGHGTPGVDLWGRMDVGQVLDLVGYYVRSLPKADGERETIRRLLIKELSDLMRSWSEEMKAIKVEAVDEDEVGDVELLLDSVGDERSYAGTAEEIVNISQAYENILSVLRPSGYGGGAGGLVMNKAYKDAKSDYDLMVKDYGGVKVYYDKLAPKTVSLVYPNNATDNYGYHTGYEANCVDPKNKKKYKCQAQSMVKQYVRTLVYANAIGDDPIRMDRDVIFKWVNRGGILPSDLEERYEEALSKCPNISPEFHGGSMAYTYQKEAGVIIQHFQKAKSSSPVTGKRYLYPSSSEGITNFIPRNSIECLVKHMHVN